MRAGGRTRHGARGWPARGTLNEDDRHVESAANVRHRADRPDFKLDRPVNLGS